MSAARKSERAMVDSRVIDMDVHLRASLFLEREIDRYLDEPHLSRVKHTTPSAIPSSGWNRYLGGRIERKDVGSPEDIARHCETYGIDHPIVNTASYINRALGTDFAVALMRGANDHLLDSILDGNDDFYGLISLSMKDPDAAAAELDRLGDERQLVGAYVVPTGEHPPMGDPSYDVVYQAAVDNDLHIVFHSNSGGMMIEFPRQNYALETYFAAHTLSHPWSHMLTLTSLTEQGTFAKFPELRFIFLEAGIAWVPYLMFRMNKEYAMRRSELPLLEKSPEAHIRESCFFASQPIGEPERAPHMQHFLDIMGPEMLMFATDYPHWDYDNPEAFDQHLRGTFDREAREQVLHGNAESVFDLR